MFDYAFGRVHYVECEHCSLAMPCMVPLFPLMHLPHALPIRVETPITNHIRDSMPNLEK
jgi:hypothetical protein